jgi:MoaA/NifB/PqqE/SkfB family radical SAM enzyme
LSDELDGNTVQKTFLRDAGLVMTYRCEVACPHCILEAGPHRTEEVSENDTFDWIRQIAGYRSGQIEALSLTGGEPFYNFDGLRRVSSFADGCGLIVSAVTNAYWASDKQRAVALLRQLGALKMLAISADEHHQKHIPFERVHNAVAAAKECGIPYAVIVCTESKDEPQYQSMVRRLGEITEADKIATVITFPVGRALRHVDASKYERAKEPARSACPAASAPIILPDGRVNACIGPILTLTSPHPLALGSLRERSLQEILDAAEVNPILHAIRIWGPRKLLALARDAGLGQLLPEEYVKNSVCHTCYCLMTSPGILDWLQHLAGDPEFVEEVAYGRVYYLGETRMVELLGLGS